MTDAPQLITNEQTFYLILLGSAVPIIGYLVNSLLIKRVVEPRLGTAGKEIGEALKAIVQVVLSALAGYGYTKLFTDANGFINLSEGALSSVVVSLFSHNILWKPAQVNVRLGATPTTGQTPQPVLVEQVTERRAA